MIMLRLGLQRGGAVFRQFRPASSLPAVPAGMTQNEHAVSYPVSAAWLALPLMQALQAPSVGTPCPVFRSDAEARIAEVPVIMVEGDMAYCDGGMWPTPGQCEAQASDRRGAFGAPGREHPAQSQETRGALGLQVLWAEVHEQHPHGALDTRLVAVMWSPSHQIKNCQAACPHT